MSCDLFQHIRRGCKSDKKDIYTVLYTAGDAYCPFCKQGLTPCLILYIYSVVSFLQDRGDMI
jgi:hypothetical protein